MIITLLTDFGVQDTFIGVIKGVIKSIAPNVDLIDLTHYIPAQDIRAGAFALKTAYQYFPTGTIHLAVVDPGVGSLRRPVAAHIGGAYYVCPDNGLLSYILAQETLHQAVILDNARYHLPQISRTFHGRDIFAPVAAHLSQGTLLETLGTLTDTLQTFPLSQPIETQDMLLCHILYCDVFGNVFTDLTEHIYATWRSASGTVITANGIVLPGPVFAYSDVPIGMPLALFGSSGHLEIAVRNGNARTQLSLSIGDTIILSRKNAPASGTETAQ